MSIKADERGLTYNEQNFYFPKVTTIHFRNSLIAKILIAECPIAQILIADRAIAKILIAKRAIAKMLIAKILIAEMTNCQNTDCQNTGEPSFTLEKHEIIAV